MSDYKDKLLKEKRESMNQGDRIEYNTIHISQHNHIGIGLILTAIFISTAIFLLLFWVFISILTSNELISLIDVAVFPYFFFGITFLIFSIILVYLVSNLQKKYDKRLEEFIEKRSKK